MKRPEKGSPGGLILLLVLCLYLAGGLAAITVYGREGRAADNAQDTDADELLQAEEPVEDTIMSETEYEEFMATYGSAGSDTETENEDGSEAESEFDVERLKNALAESDEAIREAEETVAEAEKNREAGYTGSSAEKKEEETKEEVEVDPDRKYYTFTVQGMSGLTLHGTKTEHNDSMLDMPEGATGYVIEEPAAADKRTLVLYKGSVGYASNMYIVTAEISAEDYPSELLSLSADDAGEEFEDLEDVAP